MCILVWSWICNNPELTAGFVTSLVLAIGLGLSLKQLTLMKKTGQAGLINRLSQYWDSEIMRGGRNALWETRTAGLQLHEELERCKEEDFEKWLRLTRVGNFFEEMGNLAHDKDIDLHIILGRFKTSIVDYYDLYKCFIDTHKDEQPTLYKYFKWLAKEIQKLKT